MKTQLVLFAIGVLSFGMTTAAFDGELKKRRAEHVITGVEKVQAPTDDDSEVVVAVRVQEGGCLEVIRIESDDPARRAYVMEKMKKVCLEEGSYRAGEVFYFRLSFVRSI